MVIKTAALVYDDRLRKEIHSCQTAGFSVSVHALQDDNVAHRGQTWGGAPYRSYRLLSRRLLGGHRFVVLHVLEFLLRVALKGAVAAFLRPRANLIVWLHDPVLMPFLPLLSLARRLGLCSRIVWDQHELPPQGWLRVGIPRRLLRWACRLPDALICANHSRVGFLSSAGVIPAGKEVCVVQNYADAEYARQPVAALPDDLSAWLNGEPYLFVQSGGQALRHAESMFEAILSNRWPELKVVMAGGIDKSIRRRFQDRSPEMFRERIWLQGMVPQMELARFADHSQGCLVLYREDSPNQIYCEPNRLYQALSRGVPVIVGHNPPMADTLRETKAGLILDDDGADSFGIVVAVRQLLRQSDYREAAMGVADVFLWESQQCAINEALGLSANHDDR